MKKTPVVVLEGTKGSWANKQYVAFLTSRALNDKIKLVLTDIGPIDRNLNNITYLDKANPDNLKAYIQLKGVDYVFIVTPPRTHCSIAESWLKRDGLSREGKIFIEKPLSDSYFEVDKRLERMSATEKNRIWVFDHYLSRSFPFLKESKKHLEKIGKLINIECRILESISIPVQRIEALEKGVIFDLLHHANSIIEALLEESTTPLGYDCKWRLRFYTEEIKTANYSLSLINSGTFALVKYGAVRREEAYFVQDNDISGRLIPVTILLGKGVDTKDYKVMILTGPQGKIVVQLSAENKFFFQDIKGGREELGFLDENPVQTFLETLLDKREEPLKTPGVLSFDTAFLMLAGIQDIYTRRTFLLPLYEVGDSFEKIMSIAKKHGPPRLPDYQFGDTPEQILQKVEKALLQNQ